MPLWCTSQSANRSRRSLPWTTTISKPIASKAAGGFECCLSPGRRSPTSQAVADSPAWKIVEWVCDMSTGGLRMRNWMIACASGAVLVAGLTAGLNAQDKAKPGNAAKGKEVFDQCSVCHNADSTETKVGPGLKGLFKMDKLVNGKPVTEATVRDLINTGGNGMPAYSDQLSE